MTIKLPAVRQAIISTPCFGMPFNRNSYTNIFSRFGVALDVGCQFIDKLALDEQHADLCQAIIDEVVAVLSSDFAAINLEWIRDKDEVPFWRALVEDARAQLEMYAQHASRNYNQLAFEQRVVTLEMPAEIRDKLVSGDWYVTEPAADEGETDLLGKMDDYTPPPTDKCC